MPGARCRHSRISSRFGSDNRSKRWVQPLMSTSASADEARSTFTSSPGPSMPRNLAEHSPISGRLEQSGPGSATIDSVDCDVAREALSARIDGEREPVPAPRVDEHLATCEPCREWYAAAVNQTRVVPLGAESLSPGSRAAAPPSPPTWACIAAAARLGVTGEDRDDDRLVLLVGVRDVAAQQRDLVEQRVEPHPVLGHQRHQRRRPRRLGDRQVQPRVQPPVVLGRGAADVGQPRPQRLRARRRSASGWRPSGPHRPRGSRAAAARRRSRRG